MHHDYPPVFGRRLARFIADEDRWRALRGPWFTKPEPRFTRPARPRRFRLAALRRESAAR